MDGSIDNRESRFRPLSFPTLGPGVGEPGLFDAVFEESEAGLLILDLDLAKLKVSIADANPAFAAWTGHDRDALIGRNLFTLIDGADHAEGRQRLLRATARHAPATVRLALRCADGTTLPCSATVRPVGSDNPTPRMVLIARRADLSLHQALKAAERERDAAMLARERLLSRISHDLRTPLNGILGFAELIGLMPGCADSRHKGYAADIFTAGRELLSRVEDLLAAAEILGPETAHRRRLVSLPPLIARASEAVALGAASRRLKIRSRIEAALPVVAADPGDLSRMLAALFDNAVREAPEGSVITLSCQMTARGDVALVLTDRGPAIGLDEIEAAMAVAEEPQDVYRTPHRRCAGGLPMAHLLAARNGGRLEAGVDEAGDGFRLSITFPHAAGRT